MSSTTLGRSRRRPRAVNAATLRAEFDTDGNALRTRPCYGDYRTPSDDDCLAPVSERAWSSPIFLNQPRE